MVRHLAFLLLCCAACSLDEGSPAADADSGTPDVVVADVTTNDVTGSDVTASDVVAPDAGKDAIDEPGPPLPCSTDASVCSGAIPGGWTLTAFAPNRATACPGNFTSTDVVAAPMLQAGACACSCNIATQPSCALGAVTLKYSSDSSCGTTYATYNITTAGACTDYGAGNFTLVSHHSYTKLGLTSGTCTTPSPVVDTSKVGSTGMRTCNPSTACAEDVCNGVVPSGTRSCIATNGDVPCPGGPFSDKVAVIGSGTTLSCAACSACNVTQSACGNGTVKFWGDANCTQAKGSETADGICNVTGGASGVNHFTYENPVQNVLCNAGASAPTVDLATKRTVCCRL